MGWCFFPGCVFVRDAEATGCGTNPVIPSIPKWDHPGPDRAVRQCSGQISISTVGNEADADPHPTEEPGGIDVDPADPDGEVERSGGDGDDVAPAHRGPASHEDPPDEPVGGAHPSGVVDADEQRPGDRPGETDDPVGGRPHHVAVARAVFDPSIPGAVGTLGKAERVEDRGVGRGRQDQRGPARRHGGQEHRRERDAEHSDERHSPPSRVSGKWVGQPCAGCGRR